MQEEPYIDRWETQLMEEYGEYLAKVCKCEFSDECECMSFDKFKRKAQDDLESYWDWREPEDYEEYHV